MKRLPGSERFLRTDAAPTSANHKIIDQANAVSIFDVLDDFFDLSLPREGRSYKSWCPFIASHMTRERSWRTYPNSNSSMCFDVHGYMGPVKLIQIKESLPPLKAAYRILDAYGLSKPKHYKARYEGVLRKREQTGVSDYSWAVEALQLALRQHPDYMRYQYHPTILEALDVCMHALESVPPTHKTLSEWLDKATRLVYLRMGECRG